ncbi:MAG: AgmX/PglI C-terminal domain-containing protein, partial [Myxococcota bacterium]
PGPRAEGPEAPAAEPPSPAPEPGADAPLEGRATAVAGTVRVTPAGNTAQPLEVGTAVPEGATLQADPDAEAHVRLGAGTGLVFEGAGRLELARADSGLVRLLLREGRVSSRVGPDGAPARFEVQAGAVRVRVTGTHFAVRRQGDAVTVEVTEGAVEVAREGEALRLIRAPGRWSSVEASPEGDPRDPRAPVGLSESADRWPVLRLHPPGAVRGLEVAGRPFRAAGRLALRVPPGAQRVFLLRGRDERVPVDLTVGREGLSLSEAELSARLPEPVGHLPPGAIQETLRRIQPRLQSCYERAMRRRPDLHGRYRLEVRVGRSGVVQRARLSAVGDGDTPPAELSQCVIDTLRRRPFPAPRGGPVSFEVPLRFQRVSP